MGERVRISYLEDRETYNQILPAGTAGQLDAEILNQD